jgi:hypothetical protein
MLDFLRWGFHATVAESFLVSCCVLLMQLLFLVLKTGEMAISLERIGAGLEHFLQLQERHRIAITCDDDVLSS